MASVKLILTLGLILSVSSVFGRRSHRRRFEDSRESSDGLQFNGQTNAEDYLPTDPEQVPQEDTGKVNYLAITDFTLQLTKQLMRTENNNLVVSPVSISTLLAMLAQGARPLSPTQQELEGVLNLNKRSAQLTYKSFGKDLRRSSGNDVIFENAIFTKEALNTERLATNFNAAVETVSFSNPPQAARTINNWVETKTHGKISNLITPDAIDHSTQCVLVNAIFFKNQWVAKFDESKTKVQEFAVTERERINVPFMNLFGDFPAGKDDAIGAVWLKLAFANSEYSMVFILPKVQNRLDNLIEGLTTDDLHKMLSSTQKRPVSVHIPRFKFEYNTQLNSALKAMGLTHIFEDNNRDLKIGNTPVRVSNALQKAVISVDEKGASAAAASALVVNTLSLNSYSNNINFMANHPFLAVLVNKKSIPIFVAKVSNPLLSN